MAKMSGNPVVGGYDLYTWAANPIAEVGQLVFGQNGKAFRYVKAGASALVVGNVVQAPAIDTQFDDMATTAQAAGLTTVTVTNGTTVLTGNEFAGGSLSVSVTPGLGDEYTIIGNSSAGSGATLTLYIDSPLRTAWTTSTKVTLRNLFSGVIQCPVTTLTGSVAGVAIAAIAASNYGWIQTKGVAGVLSDNSTGAVGSDVGVPGASAGAVGVNVAGTGKSNSIGRALRALSSGKVIPVYLFLD